MSDKKKDVRTEIGDLGEFGLINKLASEFPSQHQSTIMGIGDDAAVLANQSTRQIVSKDMMLEGVHFDLSYTPLQHLGYKLVAVNVSDIAAMNGIPSQFIVGLGLSNRFSVEAVEALYEGIRYACEDYKVDLVGGDTTASPSGLVLSGTIIGQTEPQKIVHRNGAEENDIICVTGDLGGAFVGLQVLNREKEVFQSNPDMQPELDKYQYVVGRQLKPKARMDIIYELNELGIIPTSMIDVSDGLASELFHISEKSGVGIAIYEDKLPIDKETFETAAELNMNPVTCALNGGEDYELLFTIGQSDYEKIKNHQDITTIGYVDKKANGRNLVTSNGTAVSLQAQGWKHF